MNVLTVKNGNETRIIPIDSILAIEVNDYLCKFYEKEGTVISCINSLQRIQTKLPDFFIRISRNCIINTKYVQSIYHKKREVTLVGGKIYNFSVRNTKKLKNLFS